MAAPRKTKIGDVTLDAAISIRYVKRITVTRHPVEEGTSPSDHAREEPEDLVIDGVVSSFPLTALERDQRGELERGKDGYAEDQWKTLLDYATKRDTLTVTIPQRSHENMMLTALERTYAAALGGAVRFTATLSEMRFVKTENVRLSQTKKPTKVPQKANGKVDQSKQPASQGNGSDRSIAKTWTDAAGWTGK